MGGNTLSCSTVLFLLDYSFSAFSARTLNSGLHCKLTLPIHTSIYPYLDSSAITPQNSCHLDERSLSNKASAPYRGRWHQHRYRRTAARSGGLEWGLGAEDSINQLRRAVPLVANRHKSRNPKIFLRYCRRCLRISIQSYWVRILTVLVQWCSGLISFLWASGSLGG